MNGAGIRETDADVLCLQALATTASQALRYRASSAGPDFRVLVVDRAYGIGYSLPELVPHIVDLSDLDTGLRHDSIAYSLLCCTAKEVPEDELARHFAEFYEDSDADRALGKPRGYLELALGDGTVVPAYAFDRFSPVNAQYERRHPELRMMLSDIVDETLRG